MQNNKWNTADADGNIHVPDELDKLLNKVGMQMRFHTISGKNELQTVCDIVYVAQQFFPHWVLLKDRQPTEDKYYHWKGRTKGGYNFYSSSNGFDTQEESYEISPDYFMWLEC